MDKQQRWPALQGYLNSVNHHMAKVRGGHRYITQAGLMNEHGVVLRPKRSSWVMRAITWVYPRWERFWTTWRHPFGVPTIYYPSAITDPLVYQRIIQHELVHVEQQKPWWGPWWTLLCVTVFPLPVFFSGRWFIERDAYLDDIVTGRLTLEQAVRTLHASYGRPWPQKWMRSWFKSRMADEKRVTDDDITPVARYR